MMRIAVTGSKGQVATSLIERAGANAEVVALGRPAFDLIDRAAVVAGLEAARPDVVVNAAAYTAVDKAETDIDAARRLNADVPRIFAEEAARSGAALVHYSTDYVFDGTKEGAYIETDETNPQNVYGLTKLEGEQAIAATGCAHLILRTSWVYGRRGKNFLLTMLKLGGERPELRVVADQIGAPTWSKTIAVATSHIIAQALAADAADWWERRSGVYHFTAAGATSWHGFAEAIFVNAMGGRAPKVVPIPATDYPVPATRPANSRLSHDKLTEAFRLRLPDWADALKLCLSE